MSEVAKRPAIIPNPATGEVIELSGPTDELAKTLDGIRDLERQLRTVKERIGEEITARLDVEARRSAEVGEWRVETQAPTMWETDAEGLREALMELHSESGVLSEAAITAAVPIKVEVKASRRGLNALHKHADDRVRELVAGFDREVPNPARRVSVKRA